MSEPKPAHYYNPYAWLAPFYDRMASTLLLPFGGEERFRRKVVDAMELRPGTRVLEMGCGTGSMTRLLTEQGAEVLAVDLSEHMLERARRKAPLARFLQTDLTTLQTEARHEWALLSFVIHELSVETRRKILATARRCAAGGRLLVLDFARPENPLLRAGLGAYLRVAEPELARDLYQRGARAVLESEGLQVEWERPLAGGTAQITCARLP